MSNPNPSAHGATPIGEPARKKRPWWLLLLLAVIILVVLLIVLSRCGGNDSRNTSDSSPKSSTSSSSPTPSGAPTTSASPSTSASPDASGSSGGSTGGSNATGALNAGHTDLLDVVKGSPAGALTTFNGRSARAIGVPVQSVPADEGFWVGNSSTDRVWVQLTGTGESRYHVKQGDKVDFTGTVVTNAPGFAKSVGVALDEGARQLNREKSHVRVRQGAVSLSK